LTQTTVTELNLLFLPLISATARDFGSADIDFVLCGHGTNDGLTHSNATLVTASAYGWIKAIRAIYPQATLIFQIPFGGFMKEVRIQQFEIFVLHNDIK